MMNEPENESKPIDEDAADPDDGPAYRITSRLMPSRRTSRPVGSGGAQAPSYDREVDEPAFDAAWRHVAELKSQGKFAPVPPFPKGGLRLRGPRHREAE